VAFAVKGTRSLWRKVGRDCDGMRNRTRCPIASWDELDAHFRIEIDERRRNSQVVAAAHFLRWVEESCRALAHDKIGLFAETLKLFTSGGNDLDSMAYEGRSAVHIAAERHRADILAALFDAGAESVNARSQGRTPLVAAVEAMRSCHRPSRSWSSVVGVLLDAGAEVNVFTATRPRLTLLAYVVKLQDAELVRLMCAAGADLSAKYFSGQSLLGKAVERGDAEVGKVLLRHGADVDARDGFGDTPLLRTLRYMKTLNRGLISELVRSGADVNAVNSIDGSTALTHLLDMSNERWVGAEETKRMLEAMLDWGLDPNQPDGHGLTPLYNAIRAERRVPHVVLALLRRGADARRPLQVSAKAGAAQAPVVMAAALPDIERALVAYGADLDVDMTEDQSLLQWALSKRYFVLTELCLRYSRKVPPEWVHRAGRSAAFLRRVFRHTILPSWTKRGGRLPQIYYNVLRPYLLLHLRRALPGTSTADEAGEAKPSDAIDEVKMLIELPTGVVSYSLAFVIGRPFRFPASLFGAFSAASSQPKP